MLGYGDLPVHIAEGKVKAGQGVHGLTPRMTVLMRTRL